MSTIVLLPLKPKNQKMKTACLTGIALFAALPCTFAQEAKPRLGLTLGVVNNYDVLLKNGPVNNYYSLGSKIKFVFNDAWYVGYTQLNSVAPKNALNVASTDGLRTGVSEYALIGGHKWNITPKVYALAGARIGVSQLVWRNRNEFTLKNIFDDDDTAPIKEIKQEFAEEFKSGRRQSFLMAGAEAGLGFKLNKFLALETSATYRQHFRNDNHLVGASDLNKVGVAVSLVGTLNLQ